MSKEKDRFIEGMREGVRIMRLAQEPLENRDYSALVTLLEKEPRVYARVNHIYEEIINWTRENCPEKLSLLDRVKEAMTIGEDFVYGNFPA
jgi:hypothetical protein